MRRLLNDTPYARYDNPNGFFGFFNSLLKNRRRSIDWFHEVTLGLPVCKFFGMPMEPTQVFLFIRDPAGVRHFLKDSFENFTKPGANVFMHFLKEWIGEGIFTLPHGVGSADQGQAWLMQRKTASAIFSRANFTNNMGEVFVQKGERLCSLLSQGAKEGRQIDLQRLFFGFTMDSIMHIFFGAAADTMGGKECTYGDSYDLAHRSMLQYVRPSMPKLLLMRFLPWPFGGSFGLAWQVHGTFHPACRRFRAACRTLRAESDRMVARCIADPRLADRKDLLALFVQAELKSAAEKLNRKGLRDMILNFVIAGRDTTACVLSWMFFVLSTNPEVQRRLAAEVDKHLPLGTKPTLQSLTPGAMPYLNGVLFEVLRLYPPVPIDHKTAQVDEVLPDGTRVPKGTTCMFSPYAMGRDPVVHEEPEAVRPERWIPFQNPAPHEFPVFQAGPRICLGMDMALFEAKVATTMLLQRFSFELAPGELEKITYSEMITMSLCNSKNQDSHNLWVLPRERAQTCRVAMVALVPDVPLSPTFCP